MDEFEHELRSAFDHLADGASPSDDLVARTTERSVRLRRNRRVVGAATVTAAIAVIVVVASVAGAGTRGHVDVSGPPVTELPSTPSTQPPASTTVVPPVTTTPARGSTGPADSTAPTSSTPTTIPGACNPPIVVADDNSTAGRIANFTLLADGDVKVDYYFLFGHDGRVQDVALDDGTRSSRGFTKIYAPTEFGTHWYDEWSTDGLGNAPSCTERHTFVVDPATATPDTTPVSTTVPGGTSIPDPTTLPDTTTVPSPPTSGG